MARVVRERIKRRNKEIKQAIDESKKMIDTESLDSDNEIEQDPE